MSGLALRLGTNFKQIKKFVNKDVFLFSLVKFKGVRIAEMSLCSTVCAKKETETDTDINKDLKDKCTDICIIEQLVINTAKSRIKSELKDDRWCFLKSKGQPDFELDWSEVIVIPAKPNFQPINTNKDDLGATRVISSTLLANGSNVPQWHKIKTDRQIVSACESSLVKGCIFGGNIEITLPAPDVLGFSAGFKLRCAQNNFEKESIAWSCVDCIKIPKGDTITVKIQSKEQRKQYNFTALIGVRGAVIVQFNNPATHTVVKFPISIEAVFKKEIPKRIIKEENGTMYFEITGTCTFKYDIDHEVIISSN